MACENCPCPGACLSDAIPVFCAWAADASDPFRTDKLAHIVSRSKIPPPSPGANAPPPATRGGPIPAARRDAPAVLVSPDSAPEPLTRVSRARRLQLVTCLYRGPGPGCGCGGHLCWARNKPISLPECHECHP